MFCLLVNISSPVSLNSLCISVVSTKSLRERSGTVLDSRPRGRGFEPHRCHCFVVWERSGRVLESETETPRV